MLSKLRSAGYNLLSKTLRVLHNIFVSIDYGASMLIWLHEEEPMTVSSRCGLALRLPHAPGFVQILLRGLGRVLNFIDRGALRRASNHCEEAVVADILRAKAAIERLNPSLREPK